MENIADTIDTTETADYKPDVKEVIETFPDILQKLLDDTLRENKSKVNILQWESKFVGNTDYIDSIKPEYMTESVMVGVDQFKRSCLMVRINITYLTENRTQKIVQTFFQRYTGNITPWMPGCVNGYNAFNITGQFISSSNQWGSQYNTEFYHKIYNLLSTGKYVDEEKEICLELY